MSSFPFPFPGRAFAEASTRPRLRLVGRESPMDPIRIERIRAEIHAGTYETQARLDETVDRLLARFSR